MRIYKKAIIIFLIIAITASGFFLAPRQTNALSTSDILKILGGGVGLVGACEAFTRLKGLIDTPTPSATSIASRISLFVPVIDSTLMASNREKSEKINCMNFVSKFLLTNLKKRFLAELTDQTVKWIQGEGSPRFVTDPGSFFEDAAQAAIGDTAIEVGLGDLCSPAQQFRLQIQLQRPAPFTQQVSCTLDDIVGNITAFKNDFRNGGWVGYMELLKPQNNIWGLELLAQSQFLEEEGRKKEVAQYEASVGGGFLSQKRCEVWERVEGQEIEKKYSSDNETLYLESPDGFKYTGTTSRPGNSKWQCVSSKIVTPGTTVADAIEKALGSDWEFIVNADDLNQFATVVVDAIVNRLATEATTGLLGLFSGNRSASQGKATCEDIKDPDIRAECERQAQEGNLTDAIASLKKSISFTLDNTKALLNDAQSAIDTASSTNALLITTLKNLIFCQEVKNITFDANASTTLEEANQRGATIQTLSASLEPLPGKLSLIRSRVNASNDIEELVNLADEIDAITTDINNTNITADGFISEIRFLLDRAQSNLSACMAV